MFTEEKSTLKSTRTTHKLDKKVINDNVLIRNNKWDFVLSNLLIKAGMGFGFGLLTSLMLFKKRSFPVWLGVGFGFGRGYTEGDIMLRSNTGIRSVIV